MHQALFNFLEKHDSLVLTTHFGPDPDGIGAEIVMAHICRAKGKYVRIINSAPVPPRFRFLDPDGDIESWNNLKEKIPTGSAIIILDTSDEYNIGTVRDLLPNMSGIFIIDHHEPSPFWSYEGYIDCTASSVCEMVIEIAAATGISLNRKCAFAAYTGIIYDTGSFSYSKTTARTFKATMSLLDLGVVPYEAYHQLHETASTSVLLLQKIVLSSLQVHNEGRVAVQILRKEDLETSKAQYEDADFFINIPMKANDIEVSVMIKENKEGEIRCSLRSKGNVNVSKIAQSFGGGGHVAASGFKSRDNIEKTLDKVLKKISSFLEQNTTDSQ